MLAPIQLDLYVAGSQAPGCSQRVSGLLSPRSHQFSTHSPAQADTFWIPHPSVGNQKFFKNCLQCSFYPILQNVSPGCCLTLGTLVWLNLADHFPPRSPPEEALHLRDISCMPPYRHITVLPVDCLESSVHGREALPCHSPGWL